MIANKTNGLLSDKSMRPNNKNGIARIINGKLKTIHSNSAIKNIGSNIMNSNIFIILLSYICIFVFRYSVF